MRTIDGKPLAAALHCTANLETFNMNVFELYESSSSHVLPIPTNLIPARQIVRLTSKMVLLDGLKLISPGLHYVNVKLHPSLCLGALA